MSSGRTGAGSGRRPRLIRPVAEVERVEAGTMTGVVRTA
jgi:hypothetical protein